MTARYRELPPPRHLAAHVACFWYQIAGDEGRVHRVVPDACADIVVVNDAAPLVVGPARSAAFVPLAPQTVIVGARFRPGAAPSLLGIPANALLDTDAPLADVWGDAATPLADDLAAAADVAGRLASLERHVSARLPAAPAVDRVVGAAIERLARHPDGHVADLADSLGVGERQLQRRFHAAVGYGPKLLHRVLRFQRFLARATLPSPRSTARTLSALAQDAGYLDQAHLGREVRELTGTTPRALLGDGHEPRAMSDFFNTVDARGA